MEDGAVGHIFERDPYKGPSLPGSAVSEEKIQM